MEYEEEKELGNIVEIDLKKSSTKDAGLGYSIKVRCGDKATQEQMERLAQIAYSTAIKCEMLVNSKR